MWLWHMVPVAQLGSSPANPLQMQIQRRPVLRRKKGAQVASFLKGRSIWVWVTVQFITFLLSHPTGSTLKAERWRLPLLGKGRSCEDTLPPCRAHRV